MVKRELRHLQAGAALSVWLLSAAPAWAQVTVEPAEVRVTTAQYGDEAVVVTLANGGAEPAAFCLSFLRPLEGEPRDRRIAAGAMGGACGPYGEVLARIDEDGIPDAGWDPYGLAMTPEGRLFIHNSDGYPRTYELTPSLAYVGSFAHPTVAEEAVFPQTTGVAYDPGTGRLWWLNLEREVVDHEFVLRRALLLEGYRDGVPTGRRVELPVSEEAIPVGLAYDAAAGRFFFADLEEEAVWAVDRGGAVAPGYPVVQGACSGSASTRTSS